MSNVSNGSKSSTGKGVAVKSNTVIKTTKSSATKAGINKLKVAGVRRVGTTKQCAKAIDRFIVKLATNSNVALNDAKAILPRLKPETLKHTSFGHKALESGVRAATAVIDSWLINTVKTGTIDTKVLVSDTFTFHSTTSRVAHKSIDEKVIATYKKIVDHLGTFYGSGYTRYLSKRLATMGYTPAQALQIAKGFAPLVKVVRSNVNDGLLAANKAYKAKLASKGHLA